MIRERRVVVAVSLALRIGGDSHRPGRDGEVRVSVVDAVVDQHAGRTQRGADDVGASRDALAARPAIRRRHRVGGQKTTQGTAQSRIVVAVDFGCGIRRHRRGSGCDREVRLAVVDAVVDQHTGRTQRGADDVRASGDALAARPAIRRRHRVGGQKTIQGTAQRRIVVAVDLGCGIRRHRRGSGCDREVRLAVVDAVVVQHTGRTQRGADDVGASRDALAARPAIRRGYCVRLEKTAQGTAQGRIVLAVDLGCGIRGHRGRARRH